MEQGSFINIKSIKKSYLHSLRYINDDVIGLLVGKVEGNTVTEVTDCFPLFHSKVLTPTLESAIDIVEAIISEQGLKIVGLYESPINQGEEITIVSSEIGLRILEKINENVLIEPIYQKIIEVPVVDSQNDQDDQEEIHILTSIVSKWTKKGGDDLGFKKIQGSAQSIEYFQKVKENIFKGDHRKIIDFDTHFEDISLDVTNEFVQ